MLLSAAIVALTRDGGGKTEVRAEAPTTSTSLEATTSTIDESTTTSTTGRPPSTTAAPAVAGDCTHGPRPIVFSRRMPATDPILHVFTVRSDGSCLRQVTRGESHVLNWGGSLSPQGDRVAFVRKDAGVMVANADGTGERLLLAEANSQQPSSARTQWSPDGSTLVVGRQEGVWTIEVATGKAFQLAGGHALYPSWAPDGEHVVFADFVEDSGYAIEVIRPDGTDRHKIGSGGNDPYWSSTNRIVYSNGTQLVVMNADGKNVTPIPGTENLGFPVWSSDGEWIVASRAQGGLVLVRPDGSGRADLNTGGEDTAWGWA